MNPDFISFKENFQNYSSLEDTRCHKQVTTDFKKPLFKNLKIEHFLQILDGCEIQSFAIECISDFFRSQVRKNLRIGTIELYFHGIKRFLLFTKLLGINRIEVVNRDNLGAFIEYLQDLNLKPCTINLYLRSLYMFFNFLIEKDLIHSDIVKNKFRLKMPDELPKAIDPDDIKQLLSVVNTPRESALILVLLRTGMRIGELLGTKIKNINLSERKIEIHQAQKTYEGRIVYMSDDACSALKFWLKKRLPGKEYIFYGSGNRERLSYAQARKLFIKYVQKAGLSHKEYTLHCLRHTFASELLNAGMRLECLQVLLGHQDIEMTRRYARLTDNTRKNEYFKAMEIIEKGEIDGHYRFDN